MAGWLILLTYICRHQNKCERLDLRAISQQMGVYFNGLESPLTQSVCYSGTKEGRKCFI